MGLREWLRGGGRGSDPGPRERRWDGTRGIPPSGNGASSFHLFWDLPAGRWTSVGATLEILDAPTVPRLYFWALQAGFTDGHRPGGGAHLGLQWYPPHPGYTAVNWGGYQPGGELLAGTASALPSAVGNPNTRDFSWRPRRPYRLTIAADPGCSPRGQTAWRGTVEDVLAGEVTLVRHLHARGHQIESPMVWSEVFAACDEPGTRVRWSDLSATGADGTRVVVGSVSVNYQSLADGGCATTDVVADGRGIVQTTGVARRTPQGARLAVPG